jgi:hypothetical protein
MMKENTTTNATRRRNSSKARFMAGATDQKKAHTPYPSAPIQTALIATAKPIAASGQALWATFIVAVNITRFPVCVPWDLA